MREVTGAVVGLIKQALRDIENGHFTPRPLDYDRPIVKGHKRPLMRKSDRMIEWHNTTTEVAVYKLNTADSRPGVCDRINGIDVHMFGAVAEPNLKGRPGTILAIHEGACCRAARDGAVWIKQLRCDDPEVLAPIKLPASKVLERIYGPERLQPMQTVVDKSVIKTIHVDRIDDIAYVYFDFYNGACQELMQDGDVDEYLSVKANNRTKDHAEKPLSEYRSAELAIMKKIFFDPKSSYHAKRYAFVYKQAAAARQNVRS